MAATMTSVVVAVKQRTRDFLASSPHQRSRGATRTWAVLMMAIEAVPCVLRDASAEKHVCERPVVLHG